MLSIQVVVYTVLVSVVVYQVSARRNAEWPERDRMQRLYLRYLHHHCLQTVLERNLELRHGRVGICKYLGTMYYVWRIHQLILERRKVGQQTTYVPCTKYLGILNTSVPR